MFPFWLTIAGRLNDIASFRRLIPSCHLAYCCCFHGNAKPSTIFTILRGEGLRRTLQTTINQGDK